MGVVSIVKEAWDWVSWALEHANKAMMFLLIAVSIFGGIASIGMALTYEPTTDTTVQATVVDLENESQSDEGTRARYRLRVTYAYEYGGERYESDDAYPMYDVFKFDDREGLREAMNGKYRNGNTVTAYIDSDNPEEAHLKKAKPKQRLGSGVIFLLFGILLLGNSIKKRIFD